MFRVFEILKISFSYKDNILLLYLWLLSIYKDFNHAHMDFHHCNNSHYLAVLLHIL